MENKVKIEKLSMLGEGVVTTENGPIYVPFSLENEEIVANFEGNRGTIIEITKPNSNRIDPICKYFTKCGGCAMQMLAQENILEFKANIAKKSFEKFAILLPKNTQFSVSPAYGNGRRRVKFSISRQDGKIQLGFMGQKSNNLIDIDTCPILTENLQNSMPILREFIRKIITNNGNYSIAVTEVIGGLDVQIFGLKPYEKFSRFEKENLANACKTAGFVRLSLENDIGYQIRNPAINIDEFIVELPNASFLQATSECENIIGDLVVKWAKGKKKIVDLFCGIGTFALRLKKQAEITAYEGHTPSVNALNNAAKKAAGGHNLSAFTRDLFRVPVSPLELKNIDMVVLDPPRQGAEAQIKQLVKTKIKTIAYISCDHSSFARDAQMLVKSGYELKEIHGFDQFRFSPHLEIAALFEKKL